MMLLLRLGVVCACLLMTTSPLAAQVVLFELGQRVKRFEQAWEQADGQSRAASRPDLEKAVQSFFSLQLTAAAAAIDDAYCRLNTNASGASAAIRFALSSRLKLSPLLADSSVQTVRIKLEPLYDPVGPTTETQAANDHLTSFLLLSWLDQNGILLREEKVSWTIALAGTEVAIASTLQGDYACQCDLLIPAKDSQHELRVPLTRVIVSRVDRLSERLRVVKDLLKKRKSDSPSNEQLTAQHLANVLTTLADGVTPEVPYPAARLLENCEALLRPNGSIEQLFTPNIGLDQWLVLASGDQQATVRVRFPLPENETALETPRPILVAYHGVGGSENMFFENYGAGRLVELAVERKWVVVAPQLGVLSNSMDVARIVEVLGQYLPLRSDAVMLVGHSMGAAQVVKQVRDDPSCCIAAVALGGGGSLGAMSGGVLQPWFVAAGEYDFGKRGAQQLAQSLRNRNAEVNFREFADVEHLVIVQAALSEVFGFLDSALGGQYLAGDN
jgi:predicted esterase